jgi:RNA polymerase sigma-70 factor, ECF subfamily
MPESTPGIHEIADQELQAELLREAARLTRNGADAQDLVQDTLERGLRKSGLHTYGSLRTWLFHIMRNLFIDRCRRARPSQPGVELLAIPAESTTIPRWALVSDEALSEAIAALDPINREVFVLKEQERHSYLQISDRLGIPVATVGTRLLRARRKLRAILSNQLGPGTSDPDSEGADVH